MNKGMAMTQGVLLGNSSSPIGGVVMGKDGLMLERTMKSYFVRLVFPLEVIEESRSLEQKRH